MSDQLAMPGSPKSLPLILARELASNLATPMFLLEQARVVRAAVKLDPSPGSTLARCALATRNAEYAYWNAGAASDCLQCSSGDKARLWHV